jgi:hypothetical protein
MKKSPSEMRRKAEEKQQSASANREKMDSMRQLKAKCVSPRSFAFHVSVAA